METLWADFSGRGIQRTARLAPPITFHARARSVNISPAFLLHKYDGNNPNIAYFTIPQLNTSIIWVSNIRVNYIMADSEQEEPGSAFRSTQPTTRPQMCHEDRYQGYKTLIQDIAERLGSDDVRSIAFNQDLPAHNNHRQPAALEVLQQLERQGLFSHFKIQPLADLLKSIHRNDLVNKHIEPYQTKYGELSKFCDLQLYVAVGT